LHLACVDVCVVCGAGTGWQVLAGLEKQKAEAAKGEGKGGGAAAAAASEPGLGLVEEEADEVMDLDEL
jgi:hypothetical protein